MEIKKDKVLSLAEVKKCVDFAIKHLSKDVNAEDVPALVTTKGGVGARNSTPVTFCSMGLDWEAREFRIETQHRLVKEVDNEK